ncbi:MAG: RloB family protein [Treponema sp.]|nr:RloB family protein [Treponema sp.]
MKKGRNARPQRRMNPVFLVFCEGDTEEAYVNFLKQKYRLPVKVIPRKTGLSISQDIIRRHIQAEKISPDDEGLTSFLMYDLDRKDTVAKLATYKGSINISNNPALELWFLLHNIGQNAAISTNACIDKLKRSTPDWENYRKGSLSDKQQQALELFRNFSF